MLLRAGNHLQHRVLKLLLADEPLFVPCRQERRLVKQVFQVRAAEPRRGLGYLRKGRVLPQGLLPGVDFQDFFPALDVRQAHVNLPVEPAGPQQCRVQNVLAVGRGHHNDPLVGAKAVHLHQELVQGLFPLVVSAAQARAPLPAHRVDLVDEHDRRRVLFRLVKQVPDPRRAYAHIQLHKVRAGNGEEMDPRLSGHRFGNQGLTGAGRAHQQHALRDTRP